MLTSIKILFVIIFLISNQLVFAQQKKQELSYTGGYRMFHNDISNSISDILIKNKKHGYFFLLYELEIKKNKILNVHLLNDDASPSLLEIRSILKATENKWRFSGMKIHSVILPVIIHDLRGDCFMDKPMFEWFSGDKFKSMSVKKYIMIPPLVIGYNIPIR